MANELPCLLDYGVLLEDAGVLLSWNSTRDELRERGSPRVEEAPGKRLALTWQNRTWLSGLPVTVSALLRPSERLRGVAVLPRSGRPVAQEGARFARHVETQLGAPTRSREAATGMRARTSRFWKRGDVTLQLDLDVAAGRLRFQVGYAGPEIVTDADRARASYSRVAFLRRLGVSEWQWQQLKNLLLDAQAGIESPVPAELEGHEITALVQRYRQTRDRAVLDRAAARLAGNAAMSWVILDKS